MALRTYRPMTPARRYYTVSTFEEITTTEPYRPLLRVQRKNGGRNNLGRICTKYRGGGERQHYRVIDFARDKRDIPARVAHIEYDPNRSARIARLLYRDGEYRYIIAPEGLRQKDEVSSGRNLPIRIGNAMPLSDVPVGVEIHNVQLFPSSKSYLVRSAGTAAQVMAKEADRAVLKLPSGETRLFDLGCWATLGRVSNLEHKDISIGKAGRMRHRGFRSRVRAVAMNPIDHPMGGGEGKSSGGRHPCDETGRPAKGYKTRKRSKASNRYILQRRKK